MEKKTLVVLAAGMGSRFGGLKQIEPIGPNGEFIIDYSVYDAIESGFNKIVFIIREENFELFKKTIGNRIENKIEVEYVFQKSNLDIFKNRKRPLGTAHAILCCKNIVKEPFMVINADDYYGKDSFKKGFSYLNKVDENHYGMITFKIGNTLTENGIVKRGICQTEAGYLKKIIECEVEKQENIIIAKPIDKKNKPFIAEEGRETSMNMLIFDSNVFKVLEEEFQLFIKNINNIESDEFMIPNVLLDAINNRNIKCETYLTVSNWYGITYKEDKTKVKQAIQKMIDEGKYPTNLWK